MCQVVMLVGDGQTYYRTLQIMRAEPAEYACILPLPGEWHAMVHFLMAMNELWWWVMLVHLANGMGCRTVEVTQNGARTIKGTVRREKWSVEQWEHYDDFHLRLVLCLVEHLHRVCPPQYRSDPLALLQAVKRNATASLAVTYLYYYGLPYLRLRQASRSNAHEDLDMMHRIGYHYFRATGKHWYYTIAVVATTIRFAMRSCIEKIWTRRRTMALSEHAGRRVAWDIGCEKLNRTFSQVRRGEERGEHA
jgi:hypothetical protein